MKNFKMQLRKLYQAENVIPTTTITISLPKCFYLAIKKGMNFASSNAFKTKKDIHFRRKPKQTDH